MADYTPIKLHFNAKDLTGQRFTRLVAVAPIGIGKSLHVRWICRCDCGGERVTTSASLRRGNAKSCGCLQRECNPPRMVTHGLSRTRQYTTWEGIRDRCENPNSKPYKNYGGRGIRMCDRWRQGDGVITGYECFLSDMGPKPSPKHSVERIDNNGNYEPGNCRWATKLEQQNNMRSNRIIEIAGRRQTLPQWAREVGLKVKTLSGRIDNDWDPVKAVTTPLWGKRS